MTRIEYRKMDSTHPDHKLKPKQRHRWHIFLALAVLALIFAVAQFLFIGGLIGGVGAGISGVAHGTGGMAYTAGWWTGFAIATLIFVVIWAAIDAAIVFGCWKVARRLLEAARRR